MLPEPCRIIVSCAKVRGHGGPCFPNEHPMAYQTAYRTMPFGWAMGRQPTNAFPNTPDPGTQERKPNAKW